MTEDREKATRILQFSGKKEDWLMWTDKLLTKATIKGYDEDTCNWRNRHGWNNEETF